MHGVKKLLGIDISSGKINSEKSNFLLKIKRVFLSGFVFLNLGIFNTQAKQITWKLKGAFSGWGISSNVDGVMGCAVKKNSNGVGYSFTCAFDQESKVGVHAALWDSPKLDVQVKPTEKSKFSLNIVLKLDKSQNGILDSVYLFIPTKKVQIKLGSTDGAESDMAITGVEANLGSSITSPWQKTFLLPAGVISSMGHTSGPNSTKVHKSNKIYLIFPFNNKLKLGVSISPNTTHSGTQDIVQAVRDQNGAYLRGHVAATLRMKFPVGKDKTLEFAATTTRGTGEIRSVLDDWSVTDSNTLGFGAIFKSPIWMFSAGFINNFRSLQYIPGTTQSNKGWQMLNANNGLFQTQNLPNIGIAYYNPKKANAGKIFTISVGKKFKAENFKNFAAYGSYQYGKRNTGFSSTPGGSAENAVTHVITYGLAYTLPSEYFSGMSLFAEMVHAKFKNNFSVAQRFMENVLSDREKFSTATGKNGKVKVKAVSLGVRFNISNGS